MTHLAESFMQRYKSFPVQHIAVGKPTKIICGFAVIFGVLIVYLLGSNARLDDWQYKPVHEEPLAAFMIAPQMAAYSEIGFAVGGAKDINNFRKNIENNYLPLPTDMTYEGLFYCYYFDMGEKEDCQELFCPSYSYAITRDPFSQKEEYYLAVGLHSGIKEQDFQRKKLNLVIVLDISDSMNAPFNTYYYDQFGNRIEVEPEDFAKTKIEIATASVVNLLDHLTDEDRLGIVLFNDTGYLAKPLRNVGTTDMGAIRRHILEINASGGTYMAAGMEIATELYNEVSLDSAEYENRIIFLTDCMPNIGEISEEGLLDMTQRNAENKVYTTFIGIGVDFNTELVEYILKIRGANYYSVHSSREFKERMDDEFDYMVTPLVFDLEFTLEAEGYDIEKVYGSPEADEATGELMKVSTLFPSRKVEGETRGGLILLKLKKKSSDGKLNLKVVYRDRNGVMRVSEKSVELEEKDADFFGNNGIRKGILLVRYANLMRNWVTDEGKSYLEGISVEPSVTAEEGIVICVVELGEWERQSVPLLVSEGYRALFVEFREYFEKEMGEIGDETLRQELEILDQLMNYGYGMVYRNCTYTTV